MRSMLCLESFGPDPFSVGTFCIGSVVCGGYEIAPCFLVKLLVLFVELRVIMLGSVGVRSLSLVLFMDFFVRIQWGVSEDTQFKRNPSSHWFEQ